MAGRTESRAPLLRYVTNVALWHGAVGMQAVLFSWLVVGVLNAPAAQVGLVQMAFSAPALLLLLVGGAIADRVDRRRLLVAAQATAALVAGALWADGLLDLDAPLADIIPELKDCGYADATLDQVLDMRSGVRFTEDYNTPGSDMARIDIASGWRPADPHHGRPTIRDVILSLPKIQPHGGAFNYRSIETDMVAWVMERVAGTDLAMLLGTRIWQHIGATRDANFTVDAEATALADGGFNATLRDYARLGQLVLDDGRTGDRQLVPQAWIDQMRSGDPSVFGAPWTDNFPNGAYRRFWWIRDADRGDICARGVFGQFIYVDPESDLVIALVSSWPDYLIGEYTRNTMRAFDAIRDALGA